MAGVKLLTRYQGEWSGPDGGPDTPVAAATTVEKMFDTQNKYIWRVKFIVKETGNLSSSPPSNVSPQGLTFQGGYVWIAGDAASPQNGNGRAVAFTCPETGTGVRVKDSGAIPAGHMQGFKWHPGKRWWLSTLGIEGTTQVNDVNQRGVRVFNENFTVLKTWTRTDSGNPAVVAVDHDTDEVYWLNGSTGANKLIYKVDPEAASGSDFVKVGEAICGPGAQMQGAIFYKGILAITCHFYGPSGSDGLNYDRTAKIMFFDPTKVAGPLFEINLSSTTKLTNGSPEGFMNTEIEDLDFDPETGRVFIGQHWPNAFVELIGTLDGNDTPPDPEEPSPPVSGSDAWTTVTRSELPWDMPAPSAWPASGTRDWGQHWFSPNIIHVGSSASNSYYYDYWKPPGKLEGSTDHRVYGGQIRDWPFSQPPIPSGDGASVYEVRDAEWETRQLIAGGGNLWTPDVLQIGDTSQHGARVKRLYEAVTNVNASEGTDVRILPMPDGSTSATLSEKGTLAGSTTANVFLIEASANELADWLAPLLKHKHAYKVAGRPALMPFGGDLLPAAPSGGWKNPDGSSVSSTVARPQYWKYVHDRLVNTHQINVYLIMCFVGDWSSKASAYTAFCDAFTRWGDRDPTSLKSTSVNNGGAAAYSLSQFNKPWWQVFTPGDIRPKDSQTASDGTKYYRKWERRGTEALQASCELVLKNNVQGAYGATWNDHTECSALGPSYNNGFAILDLGSYWAIRYRMGAYPKVKRDALYMSHKVQKNSARTWSSSSVQTRRARLVGNTDECEEIEFLTFLKTPADLETTVNGVVTTRPVAAGMVRTWVPMPAEAAVGAIKGRVLRNGVEVVNTKVANKQAIDSSSVLNDDDNWRTVASLPHSRTY